MVAASPKVLLNSIASCADQKVGGFSAFPEYLHAFLSFVDVNVSLPSEVWFLVNLIVLGNGTH